MHQTPLDAPGSNDCPHPVLTTETLSCPLPLPRSRSPPLTPVSISSSSFPKRERERERQGEAARRGGGPEVDPALAKLVGRAEGETGRGSTPGEGPKVDLALAELVGRAEGRRVGGRLGDLRDVLLLLRRRAQLRRRRRGARAAQGLPRHQAGAGGRPHPDRLPRLPGQEGAEGAARDRAGQALVRGRRVRKQLTVTVKCMQALVRVQTRARDPSSCFLCLRRLR